MIRRWVPAGPEFRITAGFIRGFRYGAVAVSREADHTIRLSI